MLSVIAKFVFSGGGMWIGMNETVMSSHDINGYAVTFHLKLAEVISFSVPWPLFTKRGSDIVLSAMAFVD